MRTPKQLVNIYSKRMQIEETFRDLKSPAYGLGLRHSRTSSSERFDIMLLIALNRPGFPGECFICELRLPDHRFRWKHNKLFLLLPVGYGPAFPAIVDCYTSPPT
ncbi:TPA: transposase [Escherichia coli]|nr:transposase [Escherichia coli]